MIDPTLPPGVKWQFDLAVAMIGAEEVSRRWRDRSDGSVHPRSLDWTSSRRGARPFDPDDYRVPSDEEIDASLRALAADPRFAGAVSWGPIEA